MTDYQDYETIENAINSRISYDYHSTRAWEQVVHAAWNICRAVDCKDATTFETIINGIANAAYAGMDEQEFSNSMWEDSWDD